MIFLAKKMFNKFFYISIEKDLLIFEKNFFDKIFNSFSVLEGEIKTKISDENMLRICKKNQKHNENSHCNKYDTLYCNVTDQKWKILLIKQIEDWFETKLKCTILHGAGVVYRNKNILILGECYSGKTTLTYHLCKNKAAKYIDDDSIYIYEDKYSGLNFPVALRILPEQCSEDAEYIFDLANVCRYLITFDNQLIEIEQIDLVLFPIYSCEGENEKKALASIELFRKLMENIKYQSSMSKMIIDLKRIVDNAHGYQISYNSSQNAEILINRIIMDEAL